MKKQEVRALDSGQVFFLSRGEEAIGALAEEILIEKV